MDLLIVEPLERDVIRWLDERHPVRFAPELADDPQALRQALHKVRGLIIPPTVALDTVLLHHAPVLRAVGRVSGGAENLDAEACARAGVEVVRSVTATAQAEAEFMIAALLTLLRRVPIEDSDGLLVGRELGHAVVGLVGMTPAARAITPLLEAFGARVVGYDPALHASDSIWERWRVKPMALRDLIASSDAVCVQLAYFTRYRGLFGERLLPLSKPSQVLANVSPSALFDEQALAPALVSGRIAAAWFDSAEPGLLDEGRPLSGLETLQVTPRVSGTTRESRQRAAWAVARRIDELLSDSPLHHGEFKSTSPGVSLDLGAEPG